MQRSMSALGQLFLVPQEPVAYDNWKPRAQGSIFLVIRPSFQVAKCSCEEACLPWYCLVDTTGANDFGRMRLDCVHTHYLPSGKVLMRMSNFVSLIYWSMFQETLPSTVTKSSMRRLKRLSKVFSLQALEAVSKLRKPHCFRRHLSAPQA
jgi:hypothetical protein